MKLLRKTQCVFILDLINSLEHMCVCVGVLKCIYSWHLDWFHFNCREELMLFHSLSVLGCVCVLCVFICIFCACCWFVGGSLSESSGWKQGGVFEREREGKRHGSAEEGELGMICCWAGSWISIRLRSTYTDRKRESDRETKGERRGLLERLDFAGK